MGDMPREGGSTTRPILFNGDNYSFWKARMKAFLKSIDEEVWESVVHGWTYPTHVVNGEVVPKPRSLWTKDEKDACNWNNKANNAIQSALTPSEFRRVSNCETAKGVWDTLMITYEGTSQVKNAKLQVLVTKFEECRMNENEVFEDFYGRLIDIVNMRHNLGDILSEGQIIRKIMRSLPKRFTPKIVSIEDSKDIDSMVLSEFLGSLKTYEHNHCEAPKVAKGIALKSVMSEFEKNLNIDDCTEEELSFFAKNFRKFIQQRRGNTLDESSSGSHEKVLKPNTFQRSDKNTMNSKPKNLSQVKCHECGGYGHYASKCANTLEKAKNKGLNVTWDDSDNETKGDGENEDNDWNFTAFITSYKDKCEANTNTFDFDFSDDELPFEYKDSENFDYDEKFKELMSDYFLKKRENSNFIVKISDLEKEVKFLKSCLGESEKKLETQNFIFEEKFKNSQDVCFKLENDLVKQRADFLEKLKESQCKFLASDKLRKSLEEKTSVLSYELEHYKSISHKFTNGSQGLNTLLGIGKNAKDRSGLGFDKCESSSATSQTTFVKPATGFESSKPPHISHVSRDNDFQKPNPRVVKKKENVREFYVKRFPKKFIPICHHCGFEGHIRPKCFKFVKEKSSYETSLFKNFDDIVNKIFKLKNDKEIGKSLNSRDLKRKSAENVWVKKDFLKNDSSPKVFDYSKIKILKRPSVGLN